MKATSTKPLTICELVSLTGKDALYTIDGDKVRIMNFSEGQEIEVEKIAFCGGYKWALKPVDNPKYKFLAFLCV